MLVPDNTAIKLVWIPPSLQFLSVDPSIDVNLAPVSKANMAASLCVVVDVAPREIRQKPDLVVLHLILPDRLLLISLSDGGVG